MGTLFSLWGFSVAIYQPFFCMLLVVFFCLVNTPASIFASHTTPATCRWGMLSTKPWIGLGMAELK